MVYYRQSPHDGLCGFISALNALRFLQQRTNHLFADSDDQTFFDEAIECLARVPGCDLRILKGDPMFGGIDPFQVRDLCRLIAERTSMRIDVTLNLGDPKVPIAARYRSLLNNSEIFACIASYRDGSHWVALLPYDLKAYQIVDQGKATVVPVRGGGGPKLANDMLIALTTSDKA
jgi:hypothetical protein